jgi:prevent-host-death family protein
MQKTFSATEARIHFGELLREAQNGPVIVERDGVPQVVILSKQQYDELVQGNGWRDLLNLAHQKIQVELAGRSLPDAAEMIRLGREERDEQLNHLR